jgi:PAS domain S-box-containing protein
MIAIFIAVHESLLKIKDFNALFKVFLLISLLFFISIFLPFSVKEPLSILRIFLASEIIVASSFLFYRKREPSCSIFILSLMCFCVAGLAQARNFEYLSIFSFTMAHIFLVLVFSIAIPSSEPSIASYFSLKKELAIAKKELTESEERFRKIVENISDVVMLTKPEGTISYISPASLKILGYKPEELIGQKFWNILNKKVLKSEEGSSEYRIKTKKGEGRWVSHSWSLMSSMNSTVSVIRDITQQKEMQEEIVKKSEKLRVLTEELEQKVKERTAEVEKLLHQKDAFINQLSHDLKNPLNPLMNLLPIVEKREKDPKSKEMLRVISKNVEYMKNLVAKTIQLARLSSKDFILEDVNLYKEVKNIIEKNKHLLEKSRVEVNIDDNLKIKADKLRLEELFDNLLANAVKYSPPGSNIWIDAREGKDSVTISVKDTGIGMTREQIEHIFDEFYKANHSRHDLESSGLGLSICKRIVEKHGGKIWAESPGLGKGSTFYFTISKS